MSCSRYILLFFRYLFATFLLSQITISGNAQLKQEERYNRFQYHKYKWKTFHTAAFSIYFPTGYESLCAFIAKELPAATKIVKYRMTGMAHGVPNVVIYPSVDQLYESNIGLFETQKKTLPTFIFKGNRIVLFFDGNYENLRAQLYEALVRSLWESRLQEGVKDQAKGTVLEKDIPLWFKEGAIRYFSHRWPIAAEDRLKTAFYNNNFQNWEQVISVQPGLAGQAFCYFLSYQYYTDCVLQIFQQLKKKNLQRATRLMTRKPMDSLFYQCFRFYKERFTETDSANKDLLATVSIPRKHGLVKNVLLSPDRRYVAYLRSKNNIRTIFIQEVGNKKPKKAGSYLLPPWIRDHSDNNYPLMLWDESELLATMPIKGKIIANGYNPFGRKIDKDEITGVDGVNGLNLLTAHDFLLSAYRKGQSDIVAYNVYKEKYTPYTNDSYDDGLFATAQDNAIYFISNRPDKKSPDTAKMREGIYKVKDAEISSITSEKEPFVWWDKPVSISGNKLLATNTSTGTERFVLLRNMIMTDSQILSFYRPFQYFSTTNEISFYRGDKDSIRISLLPFEVWQDEHKIVDTSNSWLRDYRKRAANQAIEDSILDASKNHTTSLLEHVLVPETGNKLSETGKDSANNEQDYNPKKIKSYVLQLHSAYFTTKLNNDYFINRYQPYLSYMGQFKFPELSGMAQGGFTDLFENHHVGVAFRIPASGEGGDFLFRYDRTTRKIDWRITYSRKVEKLKTEPGRKWADENGRIYPQVANVKTHYVDVSIHYPMTYNLSVDFLQGLRSDRTIFLATNRYSLKFEDIKSLWSISTLSSTLNKLQTTLPFLNKGFKTKTLLDVFKGFSQQEAIVLGTGLQVSYHQPLYKYITLVTQAQLGYSGGQGKVLYNIGGLDNNVTPRIDTSIHFNQTAPYAFQTLVTPFRGYWQNTLYGNEYALFNTDLYFPLFQTLIPVETPLQSINLLQPGLFADLVTARETWNPVAISKGWLWSYGISARTNLAGYTLRFDIAWPGTFSKKPVWYFSLKI